ncbi:MAG: hypothetical protein ACRDHM_00365 [Actinomycetota bacterium]
MRLRRAGPLALVLVPVVFNLFVLRAEVQPAQNLNDGGVHAQMIRWAEDRIAAGSTPMDGWYPYLGLGSPLFRSYQTLPHIVSAFPARIFGGDAVYRWSLYLLLASWPISVYAGARLLGLREWTAAAAALVSPLVVSTPGLGFEHASYTWRGSGVWSQLWAMWLLPLALGFSWQAVDSGRRYAAAALFLGLTATAHLVMGYMAFLALGVWVLVTPRKLPRRAGRAVLAGAGGILTASWLLVPLLAGRKWTNASVFFRDSFYTDSYGPGGVSGWLVSGELFDAGRLSVVTLLVAAGAMLCILRFARDERARAMLGFFSLTLLLFMGRSVAGPLLSLLPGGNEVLLSRMIAGVHLGGILLAAAGAVWVGRIIVTQLRRLVPRLHPAGAVLVLVVIAGTYLSPAWLERVSFDSRGAELIRFQREADATDARDVAYVIELARDLGGGRIYSGLRANWGAEYEVGLAPVYTVLANLDADAIGFTLRTPSISTDIEAYFDESNPAHYDLFNVRYLVFPEDREPPVPAQFLEQRGRHVLWQVPTTGYLRLVDTVDPISANRENIALRMLEFLGSEQVAEGRHPTVAFGDRPADPPTITGGVFPETPPGSVEDQVVSHLSGVYGGRVLADRPAVVLLKASFDPRWEALVNGVETPVQMLAPSFVGVPVPAGRSQVVFRYRPVGYQPWLFAVGALTLVALARGPFLLGRLRDRRRQAAQRASPAEGGEAAPPDPG